MIHLATSAGLVVEILPDRCLDLGAATYRGLSLAWTSGKPWRHPADLARNEWDERFVGGLIATCGLDNVGPACVDAGEPFPQHGRIGGEPAREVRWGTRRTAGRAVTWITGEIAQPETALRLRRCILIPDDTVSIRMRDTVANVGTGPEPLMIQYHCNFGEPFVAAGGQLIIPATTVHPRDAAAGHALGRWHLIDPPQPSAPEHVFRHAQPAASWASAYLLPPKDGPASLHAVCLRYTQRTVPWLWQWRLLSSDAYVIGLEPANCAIKPRDEARRRDALPTLAPGESVTFSLELSIRPRTTVDDHIDDDENGS